MCTCSAEVVGAMAGVAAMKPALIRATPAAANGRVAAFIGDLRLTRAEILLTVAQEDQVGESAEWRGDGALHPSRSGEALAAQLVDFRQFQRRQRADHAAQE